MSTKTVTYPGAYEEKRVGSLVVKRFAYGPGEDWANGAPVVQTRYRIGGLDVAWLETHYRRHEVTGRWVVSHYTATLDGGPWHGAQSEISCPCCGDSRLHRTWMVGGTTVEYVSAKTALKRTKAYILEALLKEVQAPSEDDLAEVMGYEGQDEGEVV